MFVQGDVRCGLDQRHLRQSAIIQVCEILRNRDDVLRVFLHDYISEGELVHVADLHQRGSVSFAVRAGMDIDFPTDLIVL